MMMVLFGITYLVGHIDKSKWMDSQGVMRQWRRYNDTLLGLPNHMSWMFQMDSDIMCYKGVVHLQVPKVYSVSEWIWADSVCVVNTIVYQASGRRRVLVALTSPIPWWVGPHWSTAALRISIHWIRLLYYTSILLLMTSTDPMMMLLQCWC